MPRQLVNLQQCIPIFQPTPTDPATPLTYFTNPTGLVINGSFTVVNTSTSSVMNVNYTAGGTLTAVAIAPDRSETIFFQDLETIKK